MPEAWVGAQFGCVVALVETPLGVEGAAAITRAGGKLAALMLGGADMSAELAAQFGWDGLPHSRGRIVNGRRQRGCMPGMYRTSTSLTPKNCSARRGAPSPVDSTARQPFTRSGAPIHEAFAPSVEHTAWARLLLQAVPDGRDRGPFLSRGARSMAS